RRPLVIVALAFIAGIILGRYFQNFFPLLALVALFLIASFALQRVSPAAAGVALLAAIIATGALLYNGSRLPAGLLYRESQGWDYIEGVVASYPTHGPERTSFLLRPRRSPGYLQVFYFHRDVEPLRIDYGDELRLYAKIKRPGRLDGFDYGEYLLQRRIWGTVSVWSRREIKLVARSRGNPLMGVGYRARERIFKLADRYISPSAGLFKALLFGERGYLNETVEEEFRDAGVAHVLAVSGLHLGIIIGLFWLALRAVHLSAGQIYFILIPIVLFYLLLVGGRVSLVRAAILFGFLALGWVMSERGLILRRWADPYQGLSAAALVVLGWNPLALFDVSFQLSFSATLGIIAFASRLEELFKRIPSRWLRGLIVVSLAAQLGVLPFIAWWFHRVYLLVILANLLVIPLVTLVLWGGVAFLLVSLLHLPYLSTYLGYVEGRLLEGLERTAGLLAGFRFSYLEIDRRELPLVILTYLLLLGGLIVIFHILKRRRAAPG
ncbi:MAG: ComEC/Rec2 family competence protein, partial [Candidatus Bipolaricaulia bacterium]